VKCPRIVILIPVLVATVAILSWNGCSPSNELSSTAVPNALPDTRLTGLPPSLLESGFIVHFYWTGSDPDGRVSGFQWKMSDNGSDGISVHDTLTIDPATGDTINPWHFTTATDTTFIVSAEIPGFPGDSSLGDEHQRSFQTHTLFLRTVDTEGGVDPSPAFVSYTATTLLPRIRVNRPDRLSGYLDAQKAPPTVTFGYGGSDPDFEGGSPTQIRYLFKPAWYENHYVRTRVEYNGLVDVLTNFADSSWSQWERYKPEADDRLIVFPNQSIRDENDEQIIYIFALQAQDTAGAVSVDRSYGTSVHNVYISASMTPFLTMTETFLGSRTATGQNTSARIDIAQGQVLEFSWLASAEDYAGVIESYRYGWDLADANDSSDPNWAVLPGNSPQHRRTPKVSFGTGTHTLTVQAWDNSNQMTRFVWVLQVVPVPDYGVQAPVLLVDDVFDQASSGWTSEGGVALDNDIFRDDFWETALGGEGGVVGFIPAADIIDTETDQLSYRDIVNYRVLIWTSRWAQNNYIWSTFKPASSGISQFNWLASYQESVGNLFLVGSRILNEFLEENVRGSDWMVPWIFNSHDTFYDAGSSGNYALGFGTAELPDGTEYYLGPRRYPFETLGVAVLDMVTPKYALYGYPRLGAQQRRASACVGAKGLVLDPHFKSIYMPEGGVVPDTIFANLEIDWEDNSVSHRDNLMRWLWGDSEFFDANITDRSSPWSPQICDGEPCVDPMFRILSRFDWIDDMHDAAGDSNWPYTIFEEEDDLLLKCGEHALITDENDDLITNTTGKITAFIAQKVKENKPTRKGDVVWGFDPYLYNREEISNAIQWVLGEHFGLLMNP